MDGTWKLHNKVIKYVVCPSCKQLMKSGDIIKNGYDLCWKCSEI